MNARNVLLVIAVTLSFFTQPVLSILYSINTIWDGPGCEATFGNTFRQTVAFPTNVCVDTNRFECNSTHITAYSSCSANCTCTSTTTIEVGCVESGNLYQQWQCVDTDPDTFTSSLRSISTFKVRLDTTNYATQCAVTNYSSVYFTAIPYRCVSTRGSFPFSLQGCNATGELDYGCYDSECTNCTTDVRRYAGYYTCAAGVSSLSNTTCLTLDAIPAPAVPPVDPPAAPPVAAPPTAAPTGDAPTQGSSNAPAGTGATPTDNAPTGNAPTAIAPIGSAPAAPKAPSAAGKAPANSASSFAPSAIHTIAFFFVAVAVFQV